ncbi:MAG: response regulator [Gemmatimonadota bacterium]|nr:response regulator [Gemmatimonadota bacterium]
MFRPLTEVPEWVLLVEDEAIQQTLLKAVVNRLLPKVPVDQVSTVDEAQAWFDRRWAGHHDLTYGLVILDLGLPRASGFEVLEWLRERRDLEEISVVVLTASENPLDAEHAFHLGARGYYQKPADTAVYREIFQEILGRSPAVVRAAASRRSVRAR